ncbi:unnamed protein product [Rhodiola kirilowii]
MPRIWWTKWHQRRAVVFGSPKHYGLKIQMKLLKSSIWKTLGIQNEKSSIKEGGIFKSFPSTDGIRGNYKVPERPCHLYTNPAALSRSQNFHEAHQ